MKKQYVDQFEDIFKSESLRGERIHWKVNWFLYTIVLILSSFVYFLQGKGCITKKLTINRTVNK